MDVLKNTVVITKQGLKSVLPQEKKEEKEAQ